jgi:hypothetical protein
LAPESYPQGMKFRHHDILFDSRIIEHKETGGFISLKVNDDDTKRIIEAWSSQQDGTTRDGLFKIMEVLFHDEVFFRCGVFEKTITERVDEIKVFGHI